MLKFKIFMSQVDGLMALMESEHVGPFNLGNPGEFTMLELAQVCRAVILTDMPFDLTDATCDSFLDPIVIIQFRFFLEYRLSKKLLIPVRPSCLNLTQLMTLIKENLILAKQRNF